MPREDQLEGLSYLAWNANRDGAMSAFVVAVVKVGGASHLADVKSLRSRYGAIPHHYSSWPKHSTVGRWVWCRVLAANGTLVTGFAVHLTSSRALPGTHIGRVEGLGRQLHEPIATCLGALLREAARRIPRLLRLDARVFDEDPERRRTMTTSLAAVGFAPTERMRDYSHTVWVDLGRSDEELLQRFSTRVRTTIRKAISSPLLRYGAIAGDQYLSRIAHLYTLPFERTGGVPPPLDGVGILRDSFGGRNSLLVGSFVRDRNSPEDLVGFAWARLHGDIAVLEANASERRLPSVNSLSPGFGLMWRLFTWARERGAKRVDLGGLPSTQPAANDPLRGVIEFKLRFSRDFREVAEEWRLDPHPLLTGAASATRSVARLVRRTHGHLGQWKATQRTSSGPSSTLT